MCVYIYIWPNDNISPNSLPRIFGDVQYFSPPFGVSPNSCEVAILVKPTNGILFHQAPKL